MTSTARSVGSAPTSSSLLSTSGTLEERLNEILNSSQFTVASYLNSALEDETEDLSQRMAEVALSLQMQTTSCHEDISKLGAELQAILPRCAADVGRLAVGLEGLTQDATSLRNMTQVDTTQEEVSSSLETLSTLHALQANLQRARSVLHAAATWDTTLASVAPLLATQDWTQAVHAVVQLSHGERALRGMPHPEQRLEAIQKLQQQVLALLQPQLSHALSNMHTRLAPLQQCVSLYTQLEQEDLLQQEYVKYRPAAVHKLWFEYSPKATTTMAAEGEQSTHAFLEWLPTWLDAVLSLLNEERRQVTNVFGPQKVPDLMLKVLRECFRPILPSFKSRLEAVCASSGNLSNATHWPTLAAVYEATLHFLALLYETLVGGWLDLIEAGSLVMKPAQLWPPIQSLFKYIMAPFATYQLNAWKLEHAYLETQRKLIATQMKQVVNISTDGDAADGTQSDLADQWQQIAQVWSNGSPRIFTTLLPPSLDRLSLLNCGYHTAQILPMIDHFLTSQVQDLTLSLNGLKVTDRTLQDSTVTAALSFLQVAGLWLQHLQQWENNVRDRLQDWVKRRQAEEQSEETWNGAVSDISSASQTKAMQLIPETWSPLEVNAYLLKTICQESEVEDTDTVVSTLATIQRLVTGGPTTVSLFPEVADATHRFAKACHNLIFSVCCAVPQQSLQGLSSMTSWKESDSTGDTNAEFSYGTLPQSYITQVGEHMLALVQALEPFASDKKALALANRVMDNIHQVAMPAWKDFAAAAGFNNHESVLKQITDAKTICEYTGLMPLDEEAEDEDEESKAITEFCNKWLDVVALAVTGRLLERIMRIPSLTSKGCEHLNADLAYLVNVLSALGVSGHPHPLLSHFAEIAVVDIEVLHERIAARDRKDPVARALQSAEEKLAAIRYASSSIK